MRTVHWQMPSEMEDKVMEADAITHHHRFSDSAAIRTLRSARLDFSLKIGPEQR